MVARGIQWHEGVECAVGVFSATGGSTEPVEVAQSQVDRSESNVMDRRRWASAEARRTPSPPGTISALFGPREPGDRVGLTRPWTLVTAAPSTDATITGTPAAPRISINAPASSAATPS